MQNAYINVNSSDIKNSVKSIQDEIEHIEQRIKRLDSYVDLPINEVLLGDCLELMKTLPDNCVDCIVTDPPYSLGKIKSVSALLQAWLSGEDGKEQHSNGFMGKDWDVLPSPNVWREVWRVLKPGGYALVFAGTRTFDLMGLSLRLAGFEVQDTIEHFGFSHLSWISGQGFPKSKAALKPSYEPILVCYKPGKRVLNIDKCRISASWETDPNYRANGRTNKGQGNLTFNGFKLKRTFAPLSGRHPANVILSHHPECVACGTKLVKTESGSVRLNSKRENCLHLATLKPIIQYGRHSPDGTETMAAYECTENCPVRLLDEQTALMRASKPSGASTHGNGRRLDESGVYSKYENKRKGESIDKGDGYNSANASRFFLNLPPETPFIYQPKASRSDRTCNGAVENVHPTVKPTNLMSYLVRLVCPEDGLVLDPFMGSGSTALGCIKEDRYFIGMEQSAEYQAIALERIKA